MKKLGLAILFLCLTLFFTGGVGETFGLADRPELPLTEEQMKPYEKISFSVKNLKKVQRGMTQVQVLELLGKPLKIKKEHRRHNRWTVHYYYPESHVVNFKDGLVVGKE